jgi:hypothetical protein
MMHHQRRGALFGIEQEAGCQVHSDGLVGMQQREEFRLVFKARARRISRSKWVESKVTRLRVINRPSNNVVTLCKIALL